MTIKKSKGFIQHHFLNRSSAGQSKSAKSGAGFTIIELLVVVAIIAVLAAIVLVNVTGYINQGKNASIKGNLSTVLTNGAVFYDTYSNYTGFCGSANFTAPDKAIEGAYGSDVAVCDENGTDTTWCACSPLKVTGTEGTGSTFCTDSTGYKKVTVATCAARCVTADLGKCSDS
ncbi:MAG: type II secretion system protein [bacterium]|nr:type II secretion system protein [bacterium]